MKINTTNAVFIKEQTTNTQLLTEVPNGDFAGLFIRITGTNGAAIALTDFASTEVSLKVASDNRVNILFPKAHALTNYLYGYAEETDGVSFAYSALVPVPFKSISNGKAIITIDNIPSTTTISIKVYGVPSLSVLIPEGIDYYTQTINGREFFPLTGITHLLITPGTASNVDTIKIVQQGSNKVICDAEYAVLKALSDTQHRVEATEDGLLLKISDIPVDVNMWIRTTASDTMNITYVSTLLSQYANGLPPIIPGNPNYPVNEI